MNSMRTLYHVSKQQNRSAILMDGLLPLIREHTHIVRTPGVYFLKTIEEAKDYGFWFSYNVKEPMDIWCVQVPDDVQLYTDTHADMRDYRSYFILQAVGPSDLSIAAEIDKPDSLKDAPLFKNYRSEEDSVDM